jgi:DNA-binding Xre family transcriptional regulator
MRFSYSTTYVLRAQPKPSYTQASYLRYQAKVLIENNKAEGVRFDTLTRLAKFYGVKRLGELLEFDLTEENENPILEGRR